MIIDFHTHIFSPDIVKQRQNYYDDPVFSLLYTNEKSRLADAGILLNAMDESGIDYAVAMGFPWEKDDFRESENNILLETNKSSNGRIIPFASVTLDNRIHIEESVNKIKESGFAGIGEIAFYKDGLNKKNAELLEILLTSAGKNSLPVCIHVNEPVGHNYTGKHSTELSILYPVLENCSKTIVILAHWGGGLPFFELMKEVRESLRNVFYDTAASPYLYNDAIYLSVINIIGSEKILFGSDYPLIDFRRYTETINKIILNNPDRKNILGKNAGKLLNIFNR